jgi:hypothetical protein
MKTQDLEALDLEGDALNLCAVCVQIAPNTPLFPRITLSILLKTQLHRHWPFASGAKGRWFESTRAYHLFDSLRVARQKLPPQPPTKRSLNRFAKFSLRSFRDSAKVGVHLLDRYPHCLGDLLHKLAGHLQLRMTEACLGVFRRAVALEVCSESPAQRLVGEVRNTRLFRDRFQDAREVVPDAVRRAGFGGEQQIVGGRDLRFCGSREDRSDALHPGSRCRRRARPGGLVGRQAVAERTEREELKRRRVESRFQVRGVPQSACSRLPWPG